MAINRPQNTTMMPPHMYPASSDSMFSAGRVSYVRASQPATTAFAAPLSVAESTKRKQIYDPHNASSRMERLKMQAIGQGSMRVMPGEEIRFKAPNVNDSRDALRRMRTGGYVVPAKVRAHNIPTHSTAPAPAGDLIVASLTTTLSTYDSANAGDWVSITASEWAVLKSNISGTVLAGASDTMMTTTTNLGSGLTGSASSGIITNAVEAPRSTGIPANSYIYAFSVRFGSSSGTSFGVFANTNTSSNTGYNQLGNLIPAMIAGTNYFVLKGVSGTNGATAGLLGFFTGTKLDYPNGSFPGSAAYVRFIGDNNTANPPIRWHFFNDSSIPDSSTVLEGSLNNYGTFCIQALTTATKQWN